MAIENFFEDEENENGGGEQAITEVKVAGTDTTHHVAEYQVEALQIIKHEKSQMGGKPRRVILDTFNVERGVIPYARAKAKAQALKGIHGHVMVIEKLERVVAEY